MHAVTLLELTVVWKQTILHSKGGGLCKGSRWTERTVKPLCSLSYSKRFPSLRWNFTRHLEQRSCWSQEVLLTCRWTVFCVTLIKSLFEVIKHVCCISSNAVPSLLASLGKPQGFIVCSGRLVGLFSTYESWQGKLAVLQTGAEDYVTLVSILGLRSHDFQVSSSLSGNVRKLLGRTGKWHG